jgi:catechol 2,3-dioxygenase-like lactoylglutathione lyase family enzyme
MIYGAHVIIFSQDADADRAFMRDVLGFSTIDVGGGWLVSALPPAELAVHPDEENGRHELFFMTDDLVSEMASLEAKGVTCSEVEHARWGSATRIRLPGGGDVALYQSNLPSAFDRVSN